MCTILQNNRIIRIFLAFPCSQTSKLFWRFRSVFTVASAVQMKRVAQQRSGTWFTFQVSAVKTEKGEGSSQGNVFSQEPRLGALCIFFRSWIRADTSSIHTQHLLSWNIDLQEQLSPLGAEVIVNCNCACLIFMHSMLLLSLMLVKKLLVSLSAAGFWLFNW